MRTVRIEPTFESWQQAARQLLSLGVPPDQTYWVERRSTDDADTSSFGSEGPGAKTFTVPRRFVEVARTVARHPSPGRWGILYRVLWRLVNENRALLQAGTDPDVRQLLSMDEQVTSGAAPAGPAPGAPLLEAESARSAASFVPKDAALDGLREASAACTGCELYRSATQVVFGHGPANARLVLVGEQPGDQEDLQGKPFVGPAGEILDRALTEVGINRNDVYVTNAVKHFKWTRRGKRRLHEKPSLAEMQACRPWLEAELAAIRPELVVCLGATAAQTLLGPEFRVLKNRGRMFHSSWAPRVMATIHPSAVLRAPDTDAQEATYRMLVEDLRKVTELLAGHD